jgi:four helix bundle protein
VGETAYPPNVRPYERLLAWQHCHRLTLFVYDATQHFPKSELYGVTSQMRRAAVSTAANIAEGCAKRGRAEFRRFLDMTLGSLSELSYFALLARDLTLLSPEHWAEFETLLSEAGKTTMGLYKAIARQKLPAGSP